MHKFGDWVSFKREPPDPGIPVLMLYADGDMEVLKRDEYNFTPVAWTPLPKEWSFDNANGWTPLDDTPLLPRADHTVLVQYGDGTMDCDWIWHNPYDGAEWFYGSEAEPGSRPQAWRELPEDTFNDLEEVFMRSDFKEGQYVIYINGGRRDLGRIKTLARGGAFVAYHSGDTVAKTPYCFLHPITNPECILSTTLGGDAFKD